MEIENQVEELLEKLIDLYRVQRKFADDYSNLDSQPTSRSELSSVANNLMAAKSIYENACNVIGFTLSELKTKGYVFKVKVIPIAAGVAQT